MLGCLRVRSHLMLVTLIAVLPVLGFATALFLRQAEGGDDGGHGDGLAGLHAWAYGGVGVALLAFGVGAAAWLGARLSRSIEELAEAACTMATSGEPALRHPPACTEVGYVLHHLQAAQCLIAARSDELVAAKQEAEAANLAKSRFIAEMNHELRTPLTAIVGFSELLALENYGPLGHEKYRQYARDIGQAAEYLVSMINDLLDYAKAEAGSFDIALEEVDAGEIAATCVELLRGRAEKAGIDLFAEVAAPAPLVLADRRAVRQVVLNLVSNAVKFTPPRGVVRVRVYSEEGEGREEGEGIVEVADTGIGMSETDLAAALQPFRQVSNEATRRQVGTGLGLPLARRLTEEQGGRFAIESVPGAGTIARVRMKLTAIATSVAAERIRIDAATVPPEGARRAAQAR